MSRIHSRRVFLAAGPATAIFASLGAAARAEARSAIARAPVSNALSRAIERHRAANDACEACRGDDETIDRLSDAEFDARADLAALPVSSTEELFAKLRYLLEVEKSAWRGLMIGGDFDLSDKFGSVCLALDLHLNPEA